MYVALSRVTSIEKLFLIGKYNRNVLKVNESTVVEYSRLRESRFDTIYIDYADCNSLKESIIVQYAVLKETCCRYQQSQTAYKKRYSFLDKKSNYK